MIRVDIPADLNSEDETGLVWTFLDEATDPLLIRPGALVVAGTEHTPAVCEVVDLVDKPAGTIVHLRILPAPSANTVASSTASAPDPPPHDKHPSGHWRARPLPRVR